MLRRSSSWWCVAAAVIAIFVMPVALGCSKVSSGSAAGRGNPWTVPGVVRIGAYEDLDTLDPVLSDEFYATNIFQLIFSGLIDYDDHGNPIPDLALAVPSLENGGISRDGKTITYRLHRGVTWSDGAPLTAADVVFTYRQIMNSANNVAYRFPYDEAISVTAPDPYTVVVRLSAPSAPFVANFMRNGNVGSIVPEHLLAGNADLNRVPFNSDPVGSGPFVVARWDPGAMLDLKPNPHYFRGPPSVAEIQYRIIPNQNSLLTSVESHSIDLYMDATESQYPILTHVQGYRVVLTPSFDYEHVTFNCSKPPFDDVRVRQALAYAIDWKAINDKAYLGVDEPGMTDASPLSWAFDPNIKPYPYDPALARSILSADGWRPGPDGVLEKGGKPFAADVTTVIGNPSRLEAEQMMQAQLKQVGIELSLRNYPANVLFSAGPTGVLTAGKFDIALYGWTETPDPDDTDTLSPQSIPPNGVNYSRYADPDIAAWQDRGKSLYVRAARIPYYWKIQQRIHDEVPFHTINWQAHVNAVNTDLQNYRPAPAIADFWNAYEWKI